ncbi:MAG: hypothetical protein M1820_005394 [Bogoriella megaspora]|nr:MAG: hypothetical protein M1820_005394 [Bogoriella megaspora]
MPLLIGLEEHYLSPEAKKHRESPGQFNPYSLFPPHFTTKLQDLGHDRIQAMDAGSISLQVLSHSPGNYPPDVCKAANDFLAESCKKNSKRLAGFAVLPMADPPAAADELSRCVREHGFPGALIDAHLDGRHYDDEFFWPVFARAQELDVPIYIHPTFAPPEWMERYRGNFPEQTAFGMSIAGWGWHSETALCILRLFASGFFDQYPKIKIIIGHMGEMLPFQLHRIAGQSAGAMMWGKHQRGLLEIWKENIWVTTSGMFSLAPLTCLLRVSPIEKIMFSVDYPFSSNERGKEFVDEMRDSGLLTPEQLDLVCYKNAENLLGVKAT